MTSTHDITNTQGQHQARACGQPQIPTSAGSAIVNGTLGKIYARRDKQWGYVNRPIEVAKRVVPLLGTPNRP